ncbi:class I SAM-dependent methyltransferase [Candidatus Dojkabacteria bacterium]|nr:class I SAM-dependent methyltransferase [Candidatus Dojkabacteria bacterium]
MSKLKEVFDRIYAGTNVPFLEPEVYSGILDKIDGKTTEIASKLNITISEEESWDLELLKGLLRKGMNPVALEPNLISTALLVEEGLKSFPGKEHFKILELGFGAGWSTIGLWNHLKSTLGSSFTLYSCDKSVYAAGTTVLMLEYFKIPYKFAERNELGEDEFNGVVIVVDNFENTVQRFKNNTLHAAYSNHGVAYLSITDYVGLLIALYEKVKKGGSVISDSLNPDLIINLNQNKIKMRVLLGGNVRKLNRNPELVGVTIMNGYVTDAYDYSAARFLDFMHYLFFRNQRMFKLYMDAISSSEESQKLLREWVKVPSSDFYVLLKYNSKLIPFKTVEIPSVFAKKYVREHPYVEAVWFKK